MSLNDQFEHGRIPLRPLSYANKDLAQTNEIIIDYGQNASYHIYIADSEDPTILIDFTEKIVNEILPSATVNANQFQILIEGISEPSSLKAILNHIYKRLTYPDNENGFSYNNRDIAKIYDPNTKSTLLRNEDGTIILPITTMDNIFDDSGRTIQDKLNSSTRFACSSDVITISDVTETDYDFIYPYENYSETIQVFIGGTYLSPDQYSIVNDLDINNNYSSATLVLHNAPNSYVNNYTGLNTAIGDKVSVVFLYNTLSVSDGEYAYIHGSSIANKSIPTLKLERTSDTYMVNDSSVIPTASALYDLYADVIEIITNFSENANVIYSLDTSSYSSSISVTVPDNMLNDDCIIIHTTTKCTKSSNCNFILHNASRNDSISHPLKFSDTGALTRSIPANRFLTVIVYNHVNLSDPYTTGAYIIKGLSKTTTVNRFIYICDANDTEISFSSLAYNYNDAINVYRNGIRLFEDLDYSINTAAETITLLSEAEDGEKIVFEAIGY